VSRIFRGLVKGSSEARHRTTSEVELTAAEVLQPVGHRRAFTLVLTPLCPEFMMASGQLLSTSHPEGPIMKLTFLGKDSTPNDSPTLYATDRDTYLVQGYLVTDPEALAQMRIPDGETVVEVPKRLMKYLPPEEQQHGEGQG
jgi:hypothetical protein